MLAHGVWWLIWAPWMDRNAPYRVHVRIRRVSGPGPVAGARVVWSDDATTVWHLRG